MDEKEWEIADQLVGSIDDDGYLRRELDAIVDDLAFQKNLTTTEAEIEERVQIFIELVDFNENMLKDSSSKKAKTRRSRRKATDKAVEPQAAAEVSTAKKMKEVSEVKPKATEVKAPETEAQTEENDAIKK